MEKEETTKAVNIWGALSIGGAGIYTCTVFFIKTISEFPPSFKLSTFLPMILGLALTLTGLSFLIHIHKRLKKPFLLLFSLFTLYLFLETFFYLLECSGSDLTRTNLYNNLAVCNAPVARYDSLSGYKWNPQHLRLVRIYNGHLGFDNQFKPNPQGYLSHQYYYHRKDSSVSKRFIVLGDSFTGAEYLQASWPDCVQERISSSSDQKIELYSFALSGSGLSNWHRTFFREIVPNYEFDGIIIAIYGDDLERGFAIMDARAEKVYFNWFGTEPENFHDFQVNYLPKMYPLGSILDNGQINGIVEQVRQQESRRDLYVALPDFYFLKFVKKRLANLIVLMDSREFRSKFIYADKSLCPDSCISWSYLVTKYGNEKTAMLTEIASYCKDHHKEIIFCSIPESDGLRQTKRKKSTQVQLEVKFLADYFNAAYFDGYQIFENIHEADIENYFLKYDGHWSQKGSDLFCKKFSSFLLEQMPIGASE